MNDTSPPEGQRWDTYQPQPEVAPVPDRPPSPPRSPARVSWVRRGILVAVLAVGVALVPVVIGVAKKAVTGEPDVDPLTEDGYAQMLDALEEKTGDTLVFSATLSEDLAWLEVPADSTSGREITYWWDGEWDELDKSSTDEQRVDLALVNVPAVLALLEEVKGMVENPDHWSVTVEAGEQSDLPDNVPPDVADAFDTPPIRVSASNEYSESASITAALDGTVVKRTGPDS